MVRYEVREIRRWRACKTTPVNEGPHTLRLTTTREIEAVKQKRPPRGFAAAGVETDLCKPASSSLFKRAKGTIGRPAAQILNRRRLHGADRMDAADTATEHGKADKIEVTWAVTALDPAKRLRIGKIWAPEGKKWLVTDGVKREAYVFELVRYPDLEAFSVDLAIAHARRCFCDGGGPPQAAAGTRPPASPSSQREQFRRRSKLAVPVGLRRPCGGDSGSPRPA